MNKNKLLLTLTLALTLFWLVAPVHAGLRVELPTDSLDDGLVGYWTFDGSKISGTSALDSSGNNNTGTLTNGPAKAIGKLGQALKFDGGDDYVDVGSGASLNITGAMTACAWFKANTISAGLNVIVGNFTAEGISQYYFGATESSKVEFAWSNDGITFEYYVTDASTVTTGQWYHGCGVRISGSSVKIYINGVEKTVTPNNDSSIPASAGNTVISSTSTDFDWDGLLDDVRIYNRALSANEVKRLYYMGR